MDRRIRASLISIATDISLTGFKLFLAFLAGSLALKADAWHSFSDLIVSLSVLAALSLRKFVERREEKLASAENGKKPRAIFSKLVRAVEITLMFGVSIVILMLAWSILSEPLTGRTPPPLGARLWFAMVGVGLCAFVAYSVGSFKVRVGTETDSPALVADGQHSRMDMFSSVGVLLSLLGHQIGIALDSVVAVIIAALIAITGVELFISACLSLAKQEVFGDFDLWDVVKAQILRIFPSLNRCPRALDPRQKPFWIELVSIAAIVWLSTGIHIVKPAEQALQLRFGKVIALLDPGLSLTLPWPMDKIWVVEPGKVMRVEVGFRVDGSQTVTSSPIYWGSPNLPVGYSLEPEESFVLTGDENVVDVAFVMHARATSGRSDILRLAEPIDVLRGVAEVNARVLFAKTPLDTLLSGGERREIFEQLKHSIAADLDRYGLGVEVLAIYGHDIHPPTPVVEAFREVFSAREQQATALHQALAYQQIEQARARGQSFERTTAAASQKSESTLRAQGDAQAFSARAQAFSESSEVTTTRLLAETLESSLAGREKVIAEPKVNHGEFDHWLFSPERQKPGRLGRGTSSTRRTTP